MSGIYMVSAQKPTAVTHSVLGSIKMITNSILIKIKFAFNCFDTFKRSINLAK